MSEYLSKKAVLEFIKARKTKFAGSYKDIEYGAYMELETIEAYIESGAFDADDSEIQRLRAALEQIIAAYEGEGTDIQVARKMARIATKALSTTTEPTDAARVKRIECPCCGCEISAKEKVGTEEWRHKYFGAEWPKVEGDGNDA